MMKIARSIISILIVIAFSGCRSDSVNPEVIGTFDREISDRRSLIAALAKYDDSLAFQADHIHAEVQKLLLLSKDIENLNACAVRSREFFGRIAAKHGVGAEQLTPILASQNPHQIELGLKQNELAVYNQIIFNNGGSDIRLFSAGENDEY